MKRMIVEPEGWPCTFGECRPGLFWFKDNLHLKTEYGEDAYCESGEAFAGSAASKDDRRKLVVQPVMWTWREFEP